MRANINHLAYKFWYKVKCKWIGLRFIYQIIMIKATKLTYQLCKSKLVNMYLFNYIVL